MLNHGLINQQIHDNYLKCYIYLIGSSPKKVICNNYLIFLILYHVHNCKIPTVRKTVTLKRRIYKAICKHNLPGNKYMENEP